MEQRWLDGIRWIEEVWQCGITHWLQAKFSPATHLPCKQGASQDATCNQKVTGPSFTSSTCMCAPNTPARLRG